MSDAEPACKGLPHEWWFSEVASDAASKERLAQGCAICVACPIRADCYLGAVQRREPAGVWGGVVFPSEWRALMRVRSRAEALAFRPGGAAA